MPAEPPAGQQIGPYQLLRCLGSGGTSEVYQVLDLDTASLTFSPTLTLRLTPTMPAQKALKQFLSLPGVDPGLALAARRDLK